MNNPNPINNTLEMVDFIDTAYKARLDQDLAPRVAMVHASQDLFIKMLPEKAKLARSRRNAPSVFRDWFTQWKAMIVRVNKYLDDPEVRLVDASFPLLFWGQDPKFFMALYDAQVFLTPLPDDLLNKVQAVRDEMVREREQERQAILAKHQQSFIDNAMEKYLKAIRDNFAKFK